MLNSFKRLNGLRPGIRCSSFSNGASHRPEKHAEWSNGILFIKKVRSAYLCLVGQLFNSKSGQLLYILSGERGKKIDVLDYILCVIVYGRCIKLAIPGLLEFCLYTVNFTWLFHLQVAWNHFMYISWAPKSQKRPWSNVRSQAIESEADTGT